MKNAAKGSVGSRFTIRLHSKRTYDLLNPKNHEFSIYDIAFALSRLCRFVGHSPGYSVAQHSYYVSQVADRGYDSPMNAMWGLLHDASEAYLGDVSKNLKRSPVMREYRKLEKRTMREIARQFGLSWPIPKVVQAADFEMGNFEVNTFLGKSESNLVWSPEEARKRFLERYHSLSSKMSTPSKLKKAARQLSLFPEGESEGPHSPSPQEAA